MISPQMNAKLNEQIGNEFFAGHSYLAMACVFDNMGLKLLAKRFRDQTDEERKHGLKILDYVLEVGGKAALGPVPQPQADYGSLLAIAEAALAHEQKVTQQINALVALADKENDYATRSFLQWFVDEQVEEVASMAYLVQLAKMAGQNVFQLEAYYAKAQG